MTDLRYPIGRLQMEDKVTGDKRRQYIDQFEETPAKLRAAVGGLSPSQLDTPYRPEFSIELELPSNRACSK